MVVAVLVTGPTCGSADSAAHIRSRKLVSGFDVHHAAGETA